jgi:hypothetical protein
MKCGHAPAKRPNRRTASSETAYRSAMRVWRAAKKTERLEVNHVVPCGGRHRSLDCSHHLGNLETLCVACHREHTSAIVVPRRTPVKAAPSAV